MKSCRGKGAKWGETAEKGGGGFGERESDFRYIPFLSFIVPIFAWNIPVASLIFLKRSLVFHILLFSSISLHWSLNKAFLSLLAILWNSAFKWVYLVFSPLLLASHLFTAFWKASSDSHFSFLHFFFLRWFFVCPSKKCWNPNSLLLWIWSYLETRSQQIGSRSDEFIRMSPNPVGLIFW